MFDKYVGGLVIQVKNLKVISMLQNPPCIHSKGLICYFSGGSSTASTKSATIEMYVGSSTGYNDTMSGETMSSISEKSGSYISGK